MVIRDQDVTSGMSCNSVHDSILEDRWRAIAQSIQCVSHNLLPQEYETVWNLANITLFKPLLLLLGRQIDQRTNRLIASKSITQDTTGSWIRAVIHNPKRELGSPSIHDSVFCSVV